LLEKLWLLLVAAHARGFRGLTPLGYAIARNHVQIADFLRKAGALE
jgi:hypothetical protein